MKKSKKEILQELKDKGVLTNDDLISEIEIDYEEIYDELSDKLKKESDKLDNKIHFLISLI
jgi:hypothetical protein